MKEFQADIPHELFIRYLFSLKKSYKEISDTLEKYNLAEPSETFLKELEKKPDTIEFSISDDQFSRLEDVLNHKEREFIDILCIIYTNNTTKLIKTLAEHEVNVSEETIIMYKHLFWNSAAIYSRPKWKRYLKYVPDERGYDKLGTTAYKQLLRLARIGDEELLFFKLRKRKLNSNKKEILEQALDNAQMRLYETMYMENNLETSKIASNWGTLIVGITKQLQELEVQYDEIHQALKEGLATLKTEKVEHTKLSDIIKENKEIEGKIIPFNQGAKNAGSGNQT